MSGQLWFSVKLEGDCSAGHDSVPDTKICESSNVDISTKAVVSDNSLNVENVCDEIENPEKSENSEISSNIESSESEFVDVYIRREIPTYDGVYVKGFIANVDVVFTVDTGASISILSKRIFDEISDSDRPTANGRVPILKNADGNPIP